jgi:hypothetical protein
MTRQPSASVCDGSSPLVNQRTMLPALLGELTTRSSTGGSHSTASRPADSPPARRTERVSPCRHAGTTSQPAPQTRSGRARATNPTWVCARNEATTAPTGRAQVSPAAIDQARRIMTPNGSVVT